MSYDLGYDMDSLINYSVYYLVFGNLDSGFCVNKESFFASFEMVKNINVGHEISEDYFFIVIDINLPFVLDEERDLPVSFNKKLISKIKDFFRKN